MDLWAAISVLSALRARPLGRRGRVPPAIAWLRACWRRRPRALDCSSWLCRDTLTENTGVVAMGHATMAPQRLACIGRESLAVMYS